MKRFLFTLCAVLLFAVASAQTDSIRKGKKDPNKTEKPARIKAAKKTDMPRDTITDKRGNNRRSTQAPSSQPNNSTDPSKRNNPSTNPSAPVAPTPANPPTSPNGQP